MVEVAGVSGVAEVDSVVDVVTLVVALAVIVIAVASFAFGADTPVVVMLMKLLLKRKTYEFFEINYLVKSKKL